MEAKRAATMAIAVHVRYSWMGNLSSILTIEGLSDGKLLHPIQEAFIEKGAVQCGFCTPGMVMSAKGLLDKNPTPTKDEIREGLSGNYCRCTGYAKIIDAVTHSAKIISEDTKAI